jgi:hypothetical protein
MSCTHKLITNNKHLIFFHEKKKYKNDNDVFEFQNRNKVQITTEVSGPPCNPSLAPCLNQVNITSFCYFIYF